MPHAWNAARRWASSSTSRAQPRSSRAKASQRTRPSSYRQVPATAPSTRKVPTDCGIFVEKIRDRYASGSTAARRAWTSSTASQVGRKRAGASVSGSGSGARARSRSSPPASSRNRRRRHALDGRSDVGRLHAGPLGDVGTRGRSEGAEVAPDEQLQRGLLVDLFRADPGLSRLEDVRAPLLPRSRRWYPDELEPRPGHAPAPADDVDELLLASRAVGEPISQLSRPPLQLPLARARLVHAQPPLSLRPPNGDRERPEVAPRDDVDRRAHQRRLDDRASLERARKIVSAKALEARPQPDVRVRRVLILDPAESLERARDRKARAVEEELAREERSVQLPLREGALASGRHCANLASVPGRDRRWTRAIPPMTRAAPSPR